MAGTAESSQPRLGNRWRLTAWGGGALFLLLPLLAMQFTGQVNWSTRDFILAGVLIGGVGLLLELAVKVSRNRAYRAGVASALAAGLLIVAASGAVGMIGNEDNGFNLLFLVAIAIAAFGSLAARFRPAGMALAMAVAAAAHLCAALAAMSSDLQRR